jgi:hypothetical protein
VVFWGFLSCGVWGCGFLSMGGIGENLRERERERERSDGEEREMWCCNRKKNNILGYKMRESLYFFWIIITHWIALYVATQGFRELLRNLL